MLITNDLKQSCFCFNKFLLFLSNLQTQLLNPKKNKKTEIFYKKQTNKQTNNNNNKKQKQKQTKQKKVSTKIT